MVIYCEYKDRDERIKSIRTVSSHVVDVLNGKEKEKEQGN
jgi:hypothetical protein